MNSNNEPKEKTRAELNASLTPLTPKQQFDADMAEIEAESDLRSRALNPTAAEVAIDLDPKS